MISKHRLELFSDAVIAIIITIMVLDLRAPAMGGWHGFVPILPSVGIYTVGFLMVALCWAVHNYFLAKVETINRKMLLANLMFLFLLSLTPVVVRTMGEHPRDFADAVAFLLLYSLCVNMLTLFRLASIRDHPGDAALREWHRKRNRMSLVGQLLLVVFIGLAYVSPVLMVTVYSAIMIWILSTM